MLMLIIPDARHHAGTTTLSPGERGRDRGRRVAVPRRRAHDDALAAAAPPRAAARPVTRAAAFVSTPAQWVATPHGCSGRQPVKPSVRDPPLPPSTGRLLYVATATSVLLRLFLPPSPDAAWQMELATTYVRREEQLELLQARRRRAVCLWVGWVGFICCWLAWPVAAVVARSVFGSGSVRLGSVRFGSVRFGSVRFGSVRFGSVVAPDQ